MIEKPKRPKQPNIQDRQPPRTLQELINRYDLDNTKIYDFLDGLVELINTREETVDTDINDINGDITNLNNNVNSLSSNKINKSGDAMTGELNMQGNPLRFGNGGNIFFKEDGYGDKFRIIPYFGGAGSGNTLILQSTTGGAGEDPQNWKDLFVIHADTGEIDILDTEISVTAYINNGGVVAKKIGKLVIVEIHCSMENLMPNVWTNYNLAKLNGVTAKYRMNSPVVDQSTGLCADVTIEPNSDTIVINKRNVSSINGEWLRGQLIFIAN